MRFSQCKVIQDSLAFWIPLTLEFRILCQWNLDSGFQSLLGLREFFELYSGFQSPGFRIPQAKVSWCLESGFPYLARYSDWFESQSFNIFRALTFPFPLGRRVYHRREGLGWGDIIQGVPKWGVHFSIICRCICRCLLLSAVSLHSIHARVTTWS